MKSNKSVYLAIATIICILSALRSVQGQAPSDEVAWKRYVFMLRSSTLEWQTSAPFLLKIDFQLYDLQGNPVERGKAQETWPQDSRHFEIHSPSLVEGGGDSSDDPKNHNREEYLVRQAILAIARPFPVAITHKDFSIQELPKSQDPDTKCVSLTATPLTQDSAAYCTDLDNRLVEMMGQLFVLKRSNFRKYQNHEVPMDIELSYEGKLALTAHVTELDSLQAPSEPKAKTTPISASQLPASVMAGRILKKQTPKYPKDARKKRISGSVLITAIINKQGTMTAMDVVASPDPLLTKAAMDAVQTWTYQPYLLKGEPTEVDTTITVNFNLGS